MVKLMLFVTFPTNLKYTPHTRVFQDILSYILYTGHLKN